jgi:hypothetical protein
MLHLISDFTDKFFSFLLEDPIRPNIPQVDRIGDNKDIFVLRDENDKAQAITCVSYQKTIPTIEAELFEKTDSPEVAIFYTIWSYKAGAGRQLIFDAVSHIQEHRIKITRFLTLSPKTETARRFHLKNGAVVFRENEETVNYEYLAQSREKVSNQVYNLKAGGSIFVTPTIST